MSPVVRTEEEIDTARGDADDAIAQGLNPYPGMTYAEGVQATLMWLVGDQDEAPLEG